MRCDLNSAVPDRVKEFGRRVHEQNYARGAKYFMQVNVSLFPQDIGIHAWCMVIDPLISSNH